MIIGIDLGTTNSLAAYYTEHGPEIIPNRLGLCRKNSVRENGGLSRPDRKFI